ncbi:hypothetical protein O7602_01820 [Micromonospora sp. WMMD1128]|uniref:hypothetical protein n=1 Tax=unclassified Micromonospora TaxID=2617518 RepID=UPI00248BF078|nr:MULTISPECIES: hypothetical protein [unclassified Micromonospora]WBB74325.1 hypothetical protein O7602_01820 [Micromonospora sp. WMMD1128]WFE32291.1 hypothetical protein O7613_22300 [Micromonospora sp. WMMD975]
MDDGEDDIDVSVDVDPEVVVLVRLNVIAHVAREIASAVRAPASALEIIMRSIRDRLLAQVKLIAYGPDDSIVAYLALKIDWERHAFLLTQGSTKHEFMLKADGPIDTQVAPMLAKARDYIQQCSDNLDVRRVDAYYTYRPGKREEANQKYGTSAVEPEEAARLREAVSGQELSVVDHNLSELQVVYRHVRAK